MAKKLTDYIMMLDDVIPKDLAKEILDEYASSEAWHSYGGSHAGSKSGSAIPISTPAVIGASQIRSQIDSKVTQCVTDAYKKYYAAHARMEQGLDFIMARSSTGFRLLRYNTGESLANHVDRYPDLTENQKGWPLITVSVLLNEDYEGGELVLLDGEMTVPVKAGRAVFFPSTFLFPHAVNKVTRGARYAITTWFL